MFRMVRVPNIALMATLAALIAAAGLLLYMSPQASAQAPGPCADLDRYQPHFYGCVSGLITGQAGTLSVEANASLREDFTVTVSIDHDWSLGSELGDTGWRLDAVEVHYYVVSGADRERGWFDVADATSSVSRSYFIEAGRVSYHYSATLREIDPEPGPVYNTFYVPGGEPVPFDKPYPPRLPWAAGSTATTTPTLSSYPTAAPTQRLQRTSRSARRRPQGADGGRRPGRTPAGSARGPRSTRPRSANGPCSGTITAVPGVNAGTHRPPLAAGAMGAVMTKARHLPHAGAGGSQPRGFGRVSVGRTPLAGCDAGYRTPAHAANIPGAGQRVPPAHPARSGQWPAGTEMVRGAPSGRTSPHGSYCALTPVPSPLTHACAASVPMSMEGAARPWLAGRFGG